MAFYVTLARFTEKGLHDVKDTVKRGEAFTSRAKTYGATVKEFLWTQGAFDMGDDHRGAGRRDRGGAGARRAEARQCDLRDVARLHRVRDGEDPGKDALSRRKPPR